MSKAYDLMDAILAGLIECADLSCPYEAFVSMGRPTDPVGESCSTLAIWKRRQNPADITKNRRCNKLFREDYGIRMVQCCGDIDTNVEANLNSGFEQEQVRCFYADAERVKCCLLNELPGILKLHKDVSCDSDPITSIDYDSTIQGQCFGVDFSFRIMRGECCEPAAE